MYCFFCQHHDTEVVETRLLEDGQVIRRRRRCLKCGQRFTTYERIEEPPILVIKKDKKRERFNRDKVRLGLIKACEKTSVTADQIEKLVNEVEKDIVNFGKNEIDSQIIGQLIAKKLKKLDKIAYIRFASVFKQFEEVDQIEKEIKKLK